jgi:hypothetical protein
MVADAQRQFRLWVDENVHNIPGLLDAESFNAEIARLRGQAERDLGNLISEIEEQLGDLDDLLRDAYESVQDPELGFKDS